MKLRKLENKDALYMLEWMHDEYVTEYLKTNFELKSINDCYEFISNSMSEVDINLAIADSVSDEYLGTVSLKHINNGTAEFAIVVRKKAMGKGISAVAMKEIINIAFGMKNINEVYWCVAPSNTRAVKFYDKNGYLRNERCKTFALSYYSKNEIDSFLWYSISKEEIKIEK